MRKLLENRLNKASLRKYTETTWMPPKEPSEKKANTTALRLKGLLQEGAERTQGRRWVGAGGKIGMWAV